MMKDEEVAKLLQEVLPYASSSVADRNRLKINVKPDNLHDCCESLLRIGFNHLQTVCATDYPQSDEFEVSYMVGSYEESLRDKVVIATTRIPRQNAVIHTVSDVWPAANLLEREEWEMLGIHFLGHPELKKLYLPEDWNEIPPLLKEYRLKRWVDEERERHGLVIEKIEHEH
jgi:NADH-quinone oxidoreductase subunit C